MRSCAFMCVHVRFEKNGGGDVGRNRKYKTAAALRRAVWDYFDSISKIEPVMERYPTGNLDAWGHDEYKWRQATNQAGEVVSRRVFHVPPTAAGIREHLGISKSTWAEYGDRKLHPELCEVVEEAREVLQKWREEQLLTRAGKDVRGIIFDLQANYGMSERKTVDLGDQAAKAVRTAAGAAALPLEDREALLREIAKDFSPEEGREPSEEDGETGGE